MKRFEIQGAGINADSFDANTARHHADKAGAHNARTAYLYGWHNMPRTVRFSASDTAAARSIVKALPFPWLRAQEIVPGSQESVI